MTFIEFVLLHAIYDFFLFFKISTNVLANTMNILSH